MPHKSRGPSFGSLLCLSSILAAGLLALPGAAFAQQGAREPSALEEKERRGRERAQDGGQERRQERQDKRNEERAQEPAKGQRERAQEKAQEKHEQAKEEREKQERAQQRPAERSADQQKSANEPRDQQPRTPEQRAQEPRAQERRAPEAAERPQEPRSQERGLKPPADQGREDLREPPRDRAQPGRSPERSREPVRERVQELPDRARDSLEEPQRGGAQNLRQQRVQERIEERPVRSGGPIIERSARPQPQDRVRGGGEADVIQDVRRQRRERSEEGRTIIEEPDRRTIVREGDRLIILHDETERLRRYGRDARVERGPGGITRTIVVRGDGVRVITETDADGRLLRRLRIGPDGREHVLLENRPRRQERWAPVIVDVPPPRVTMPRDRYILDVREASRREIVETFRAPPVVRVERPYTVEEVRRTPNLLARMPRVDVDTVNFESGAWTLDREQIARLKVVADAIADVIEANPDEIFLVEGHTDAVGSEVDNLSLSDRRAETVAIALTETFGIPAENMLTQGFGETQLKIQTEAAERANRRVTVRRITPLLQGQAQR